MSQAGKIKTSPPVAGLPLRRSSSAPISVRVAAVKPFIFQLPATSGLNIHSDVTQFLPLDAPDQLLGACGKPLRSQEPLPCRLTLATYDAPAARPFTLNRPVGAEIAISLARRSSSVLLDTLRKGAGRLFGMILMGLLVISFAVWGIADIFRGYGSQTLIKVGDTEITQQEYSRTQRDVLRVMSSDAGRALSFRKRGGRARQSRAGAACRRCCARHSRQEPEARHQRRGAARRHHEDPAFKDFDRQFQSARPAASPAQPRYERAGLPRRRARAQFAPSAPEHGRQDAGRLAGLPQRASTTTTMRRAASVTSSSRARQPVQSPSPTDEDLKRFYDNHQAKFTNPEFRKIGVLAVTPESSRTRCRSPKTI